MTDSPDDNTSVRVAVRVRPQSAQEKIEMCQVCTLVTPGEPQVFLGKDKAFTFDYVFDLNSVQTDIYDACVRQLIDGTFEGYNATIFAYGQTGSGKTYSMGTGFDVNISPECVGIIPRAVEHLFLGIDQRRAEAVQNGIPPPDFKVNAQFMELYNEEILDLLDTTRDISESRRHKSHIKIHEDAGGGIYTVGVTTRAVASLQDTMQCLKIGALSRTTASTNMNAQSSRSHAIFTLHIKQQRVVKADVSEEQPEETETSGTETMSEFEMLSAKFHFVDLAGSERLKRTGATGDRAKEGISINCGLLALGNVISALGDQTKKGSHVPYRDSKLTRLLQDSLGGNSRTTMIACVSPSDRDFMETLNTLKYANRARNIKNKVTVNQDKTSRQIAALRAEVQQLQMELIEYKTGKRQVDCDGVETINDMFHENNMLQSEINNLRQRIKAMQETIDSLTARNTQLLAEMAAANLSNIDGNAADDEVSKMIQGYIQEIEGLRARLVESESMVDAVKRSATRMSPHSALSPRANTSMAVSMSGPNLDFEMSSPEKHLNQFLAGVKKDLKKKKRKIRKTSQSEKENVSEDEKQDHESVENLNGEQAKEEDEEEEEDEEFDDEALEDNEGMADDSDVEADFSSDSDTDDVMEANLHENLADLTCEITIKEKLVEELEHSQKRLQALRMQYEEKLVNLQSRIRQTEMERDKVLSNMGNVETVTNEKTRKVKQEYEKKLNDMQSEVRKLQAAKKEHAKLLRNQSHYERQLKNLQKDLEDMKKTKVKLMHQIKEESTKSRQVELRRNREVAQLRKEQRQKDTMIKSLEAKQKQKEVILRRKQEEVEALRKRQRNMSSKAAGRVGKYDKPVTIPVNPIKGSPRKRKFSAKAAKQKWDSVEKSVSTIITKKQTLSHMEKDMEHWLKQREVLSKKMEKLVKKQQKASKEDKSEDMKELVDQMDTLRANITYVQENINECQTNIVQMEESKEEEVDPAGMFEAVNLEEAKYMLQHFLTMSIGKGVLAAQKESENRELYAKLHQERMDSTFQRDMLQYLIQDGHSDIYIDDSLMRNPEDSDTGSASSSRSTSPIDSAMMEKMVSSIGGASTDGSVPPILVAADSKESITSITSLTGRLKDKARRKTATPEDLLYAGGGAGTHENKIPKAESRELDPPKFPRHILSTRSAPTTPMTEVNGSIVDSALMPPPKALPAANRQNATSVPRPGGSQGARPDPGPSPSLPRKQYADPGPSPSLPRKQYADPRPSPGLGRKQYGDPGPSPSLGRKQYGDPGPSPNLVRKYGGSSNIPEPSPVLRRKFASAGSSGSLSRQSSVCSDNMDTPPSSPQSMRRSRDENVFSRLTSQSQPISPFPNRGSIKNISGKSTKNCPLIHSHAAEGHTKAVLSMFATDDLLFSSGKDRTAKVWDLNTGNEMLTLNGHPNNVVAVRYSEETQLVFTASTYFVKVWDIRQGARCIRTLLSSGQMVDGTLPLDVSSRQVACPQGEITINDIAVSSTGSVLYSAAGNTVRLWDLRSFKAVGKLSGGHQAAVMVIAVDDTDTADGNICVVTGSKDHYIKVFEVGEDSVGVLTPKYNLEPPHYDGIQSLCLMGDLLFSGSRDSCIKKWDLAEQQLKQSFNNAHKDWVCGLAFLPGGNCILSGCRAGYLKVWHIDTGALMGEMKAHNQPINAITTNSNLIFTASNDRTVKIWKPSGSLDSSEASD